MRQTLYRAGHKLCLTVGSILLLTGLQPAIAHAASGFAANDVYGQLTGGNPDLTTRGFGTGDSQFNYPDATAIDTIHHLLFVSDGTNNRVLVFALDSNNAPASRHAIHVLGQTGFGNAGSSNSQSGMHIPYGGLAYDSVNNRLFVSDSQNHRVLVYNLANGITDGMNASYELGQTGWGLSNSVLTQTGMGTIEGLAFDAAHERLFVADEIYNRVTAYNVDPSTITDGEPASNVLGQTNFTSNNSTAAKTQNGLKEPEALAYNPTTQQLIVGDSNNYRVVIFNLANGITDGMNASYVLGEPDFNTTNTTNTVTSSTMDRFQEGLAIDSAHNILYAYDDTFNRILVFNLSAGITNGMAANFVIGQTDFASKVYTCPGTVSATILCDSEGSMTIDPATGRLFVPDASDNRVLVFNVPHATASTGTTLTVNTGSNVAINLSTTGANGTVSYALTSGSLPPGLTLNATTGVISGTPTQAGTYSFDITTSDNEGTIGTFAEDPSFTITVSSPTAGAPNTGYGAPRSNSFAEVLVAGGVLGLCLTFRRATKNLTK